jgi:endonuclease-3
MGRLLDTQEITQLNARLDVMYPWDGVAFLLHESPWQLLIATILSAQCTDAQVNAATRVLFTQYPTVKELAEADLHELETIVYPTGFYHTKARHIRETARILNAQYHGQVPPSPDELTRLPGVGRKTANLVLSHAYGVPCVVVDTHVKRLAYRLGLTPHTDPARVEADLTEKLPESHWIRINYQLITHGRRICTALSPRCASCGLSDLCQQAGVIA